MRPEVPGCHEPFPDATDGDLFLWFHHQRRRLYPQRGGIRNEEVARLAREEVERRRKGSALRAVKHLARRNSLATDT